MSRFPPCRLLRNLLIAAVVLFSQPAGATFPLWVIDPIFSNASGTVQFIELTALSGSQPFIEEFSISSSQGGSTHSFTIPADLPGDSTGKKFLIATQGFQNLGIVTPDYTVPDGFLSLPGGAIHYALSSDSVTYTSLPADGRHSIDRNGNVMVNSATNYADASGSVTPPGTGGSLVPIIVLLLFSDDNYTLSVSKTGTGTVTSSPAGINCGADCTENYNSGTVVALTATPSTDSTFSGWGGACAGTGPCLVTMDGAKSAAATFTLNTYILTVTKAGSGTGTVTSSPAGINCGATCSAGYDYNTAVTLSAAPGVGSTFTGWSGACAGTGTCMISMNSALSVSASFTLGIETSVAALTIGEAGSGTFGVRLSAQPSATTTVTITLSNTAAAIGSPVALTFTTTDWNSYQTVTVSGVADVNLTDESVTLSAASTGLTTRTVAVTVTDDDVQDITMSTPTLTVGEAGIGTFTARLAFQPGANVTVTLASSNTAAATVLPTLLMFTPADYATPQTVTVSGVADLNVANESATISVASTGITTRTVAVTVTDDDYTLSVGKTGTGAGTVTSSPAGVDCGSDCTENYNVGTLVTLTATPITGSTFSAWGGACSGTLGTCDVTMDAVKSVSANFVTLAKLVINEVNPNISGSRDLVELLVVSGGSLAGIKLEQNLSAIVNLATFPPTVVAAGDLIVVHMMPTAGETNETNTKGDCVAATCYANAWDIAGAAVGITFTNHILVVRGPAAEIIDAVPFFLNGNTLATFPGNLQALQATGQWLPADCGGALCTYASTPTATGVSADWTGSTPSLSVQRKPTADTNTQADWNTIGPQTFGIANP